MGKQLRKCPTCDIKKPINTFIEKETGYIRSLCHSCEILKSAIKYLERNQ